MNNQIRKGWNTGFFTSPDAIFDTDASLHGKMVYLYLCRCADSQAQSFPSIADICQKTGMKRTKCCESLNELEERGLLTREARYKGDSKERSSNLYTLFHPDAPYITDDDNEGEGEGECENEGSSPHGLPSSPHEIPVVRHTDYPSSPHEQEGQQIKDYTSIKDYTNNKQETVAVVQKQIESHLGTSISSLLPLLAEWLQHYGENVLVDTARYIGSKKGKWNNIVGTYRAAVTEAWSAQAELTATRAKDKRYQEFYALFPDA